MRDVGGELRPGREAEFLIDRAEVLLDGLVADRQLAPDLQIRSRRGRGQKLRFTG
jgi:hypothetical protein